MIWALILNASVDLTYIDLDDDKGTKTNRGRGAGFKPICMFAL